VSKYTESVDHYLRGIEHVSTGSCPGCAECGLDTVPCEDCDGTGTIEDEQGEWKDCLSCGGDGTIPWEPGMDVSDQVLQSTEEGSFSWSECDACGSTLGGDRHPAHGLLPKDGIPRGMIHLDVCSDCLCYLANGDEPEQWGADDDDDATTTTAED